MFGDGRRLRDQDTGETVESVGSLPGSQGNLPPALETRWAYWSQSLQGCDPRTMILLRAAFESGFEAGAAHAAGTRSTPAEEPPGSSSAD
jgi:hypothetical protein